jgi:hypothetical protein
MMVSVEAAAADNGVMLVMEGGITVDTGNETGDAYPSKKTAAVE